MVVLEGSGRSETAKEPPMRFKAAAAGLIVRRQGLVSGARMCALPVDLKDGEKYILKNFLSND